MPHTREDDEFAMVKLDMCNAFTLYLSRLSDMNVPFISQNSVHIMGFLVLWLSSPLVASYAFRSFAITMQGALYSFSFGLVEDHKTKDADDDYLTLRFSVGF